MAELTKWQKDAAKGEIKEPRMREVGAHFIDLVGGPRKFATMLKDDYDDSAPGSLNRSRIMALIVQTLKTGGDEGRGDMSLLQEDDIKRELEELLGAKAETAEAADTVRPGGQDASPGGEGG